jgi:hypothetical protein
MLSNTNTKERKAMSNEQVSRETCISDDCEIVEAIVPRGLVEPGEKLDLSTLADIVRIEGWMHGRRRHMVAQHAMLCGLKWVSLSDALYQANRLGSHWCEIDGERWFVQRNGRAWLDRGAGRWLVRYATGGQMTANRWECVLGYVRPLGSDVTMKTDERGVMTFFDDDGNKSATVEDLPDGT